MKHGGADMKDIQVSEDDGDGVQCSDQETLTTLWMCVKGTNRCSGNESFCAAPHTKLQSKNKQINLQESKFQSFY